MVRREDLVGSNEFPFPRLLVNPHSIVGTDDNRSIADRLSLKEKENPISHQVLSRGLPDPKSCFTMLKTDPANHHREMCFHPFLWLTGALCSLPCMKIYSRRNHGVCPWKNEDVSVISALCIFVLHGSRSESRRCGVVSRDRSIFSRLFLFIFCRFQVIGEMVGWSGAVSSAEGTVPRSVPGRARPPSAVMLTSTN